MNWLLRRLATSLLLAWAVATVVFLAIHMIPGDPAEMLLSQTGGAIDPVALDNLRRKLGLDQPLLKQYAASMMGLLRGDLGVSLRDGTPIAEQIALRLPRTLELIAAAGLIALVLGVPLGMAAAVHAGGWIDRLVAQITGFALAVPVFVVGTLLIMVFAQYLRWTPAGGYVAFSQAPAQHLILLAMPALSIGIGLAAMMARMTRSAMLDVMSRDFIRTARAKGVGETAILLRHVLRNAATPVLTVLALHLGALLGGTVLVEHVFNWPGLSGFLVSAVSARDYPEVVGIILVISILLILLNVVVDILYAVLDPRVRQ
ncbi:MAG: ABC transporter permease [Methylobacteriaceae bacterium]|nr:ABC transporter permease [Methylobacteriaceae bacterium]